MKLNSRDWMDAQFINAVVTAELVHPKASAVGLALYDTTANPGEAGHRDQPFRFRISAQSARRIAQALLASADEIEGTGQPRQ